MTAKEIGDQPAFPCPVGHIECHHPTGLTKREWLAGMALQAVASNPAYASSLTLEGIKRTAVKFADLTLEGLAAQEEQSR